MTKKKKVRTRKQKILHRIIVILIVLAAAIGAFLLWWKFGKKDEVTESYATGPVYDSAVTTSIEQTYAATGKIAAGKEAGTNAAADSIHTDFCLGPDPCGARRLLLGAFRRHQPGP